MPIIPTTPTLGEALKAFDRRIYDLEMSQARQVYQGATISTVQSVTSTYSGFVANIPAMTIPLVFGRVAFFMSADVGSSDIGCWFTPYVLSLATGQQWLGTSQQIGVATSSRLLQGIGFADALDDGDYEIGIQAAFTAPGSQTAQVNPGSTFVVIPQ